MSMRTEVYMKVYVCGVTVQKINAVTLKKGQENYCFSLPLG